MEPERSLKKQPYKYAYLDMYVYTHTHIYIYIKSYCPRRLQ